MPALRPIRSHTALRGIAALLVVFYHLSWGSVLPSAIESATPFFRRGYLWVDLFFVLSGFILSYVNRVEPGGRLGRGDAAAFLRSRFARVYPLHIVVLAAYAAAIAALSLFARATGRFEPGDWSATGVAMLLSQVLLLNAWVPGGTGWNVPTWSISAEAITYLLFPLLVSWRARAPRIAGPAMALAAAAFFGWVAATTGTLDVIGGPVAVLRCLAGFLAGMVTFQARARFGRLEDGALSAVQLAAAAALVGVLASRTSDPLAVPPFVLLVGATWQDRGLLPRLLSRRPLLWLGEVSYSIYLLHVPVITVLEFGWGRVKTGLGLAGGAERAVWIAVVLVAVLALAQLTYRFVERPARQWLARRLIGHRVPPIATSPAAP